MMTTVAVYQPRYFPCLHYLARAQQADVFIIYDDVQFSRRSRQHRAQIRFEGIKWLTIPVKHTGEETLIKNTRIDMSSPWIPEHIETLAHKYGPTARELAPYYHELLPDIPSISSIRDSTEVVRDSITAEGESILETVEQYDSWWQDQQRKLEELQTKKEDIGRQIAQARAEGSDSDVEELIESSNKISEQIGPVKESAEYKKEQRDEALIELSEHVIERDGFELMTPNSMWELENVEIGELTGSPRLVELTVPLLEELINQFDVDSTVVRSSEVPVEHTGDPSEYLAKLTAAFDGDRYISGQEGYENYIHQEPFEAEGIEIVVQDWEPTWKDGNVCALDVLFNSSDPGQHIR